MPIHFDPQANTFDARAGLPDQVVSEIVSLIDHLSADLPEGKLLEVGAGTGQIGYKLSQLRFDYTGFDNSAQMLEVFNARFKPAKPARIRILHTDGNQRWPLDDQSARVIFSSRALHLLQMEHAVSETLRLLSGQGGLLLSGSIQRDPTDPRSMIRRKMRQLLGEHNIKGRSGGRFRKLFFEHCCATGAELLASVKTASWLSMYTPEHSLQSWQSKPGLAGMELSAAVKSDVLTRLEKWASVYFGDLKKSYQVEQTYLIEGIRIPIS